MIKNFYPMGATTLSWKGTSSNCNTKPAFEKAMVSLYTNYETRKPPELYKKYLEAKVALAEKKVELMRECQQKFDNNWEAVYNEMLPTTEEYQQFQSVVFRRRSESTIITSY